MQSQHVRLVLIINKTMPALGQRMKRAPGLAPCLYAQLQIVKIEYQIVKS